ncbi:methyl-accepting chemotaxis protein [uncultured Alsobacter sp.]|uniref:methyl-accepting chemotaxis protein n=1 Tax=uncultured Alsobacter sp. TaxID=1748258 RepID=UPI0025F4E658|nr:methyl-accepting chemotaxis protein [uncultured Alsobacter sp.]
MAVIEFDLEGRILSANANFLATMGYSLDEIRGKHHSMLVESDYARSSEYRAFWEKLKRGEFHAGEFRRLRKDGSGIWLQATYNPILDRRGRAYKVVKFATDVTAQKERLADFTGQIDAINKSQAVIQFALDGTILDANANFLAVVGYSLAEVKGRHHSIFVDPAERDAPGYKAFWDKLRRGEYDAAQYRRLGKGGKEVWIQASYNPIFDSEGKPCKVVKFATDITAQVKAARIEEVVAQISDAVEAARNRDLTVRVTATQDASQNVKTLCEGVNSLIDTMASVIDAVVSATQETETASAEITSGSRDLAGRTEQQASALEETAATTEQLAASVKSSAQSSRQAVAYAEEARDVAEEGGRIVGQAVEAMTRIEQASAKITEITSVIDEIAFQTNLLALNAAVEAARAGDAGKGFAVVAAEVRTLAQRSSEAAKDIGGLISTSTVEVGQGVKLVREAGATLERIVGASAKVAGTVNEISTASAEQANGIDEMSQAVAHMDEMTQQNAALAEQSSASAMSLSQQIAALKSIVGEFRTGSASISHRPAPAPTVPARLRDMASAAFSGKPTAPKAATKPVAKRKVEPAKAPALKAAAGGGSWDEF